MCGSRCGSVVERPIVCAGEKVANDGGSRMLASKESQTSKGTASPVRSCHRAAGRSAVREKKRLAIAVSCCNAFVKA